MNFIPPVTPSLDLPRIDPKLAAKRHLLSEAELKKLRLLPNGAPVACAKAEHGIVYYFDPGRVSPAPPEAPKRLTPGGKLPQMRLQNAMKQGYYPKKDLLEMYYEPTEGPVAYCLRHGEEIALFDKTTCRRMPLPCIRCGDPVRYRAKLCRACFEKELASRREAGDRHRNAAYGMDRKKVLFFDLELTGLYDYDEILSVTLTDGTGAVVLDTLVRPVRRKKWKETEAIHGITPEMVKDAATLADLAPRLREILGKAERLVAFGTQTDLSHLTRLYTSRAEKNALRSKVLDCGAEFSRYVYEHGIELSHQSLTDAMSTFGLDWHGNAHTSTADTDACRRVFEALFPHYFKESA